MGERATAVFLMVALFLAGAVAGAMLVTIMDRGQGTAFSVWPLRTPSPLPAEGRTGPERRPRFAPDDFADRLAGELELSEAQRDSVEGIIDRQWRAAEAMLREMRPRLLAGVDSANQQIRRVLDEEQQARFDEVIERDRGVLGRRYRERPGAGGH